MGGKKNYAINASSNEFFLYNYYQKYIDFIQKRSDDMVCVSFNLTKVLSLNLAWEWSSIKTFEEELCDSLCTYLAREISMCKCAHMLLSLKNKVYSFLKKIVCMYFLSNQACKSIHT